MADTGFPSGILPVLPVRSVEDTANYYVEKLQFQERFRQPGENGAAINAQMSFEDSTLMLNLNPEDAPAEGGGVYFWIRLFERNIDDYYRELRSANVNIVEKIQDQFWGDRSFVIRDCNNFFIAFNQAIPK